MPHQLRRTVTRVGQPAAQDRRPCSFAVIDHPTIVTAFPKDIVHRGRSWRYANRGPPRVKGRPKSSSAELSRSSR